MGPLKLILAMAMCSLHSVYGYDLNVLFPGHGATQNSITCEGHRINLRCTSKLLWIKDALYGRTSAHMCKRSGKSEGICLPPAHNALKTVKHECQGKAYCNIKVKNDYFGDPCSGTYKYLNITYACVPGKQYIVYTKTDDDYKAATDANIAMQLYGTKKGQQLVSGWWPDLESPEDDFRRTNIDKFTVTLPDIGNVNGMDLYMYQKSSMWKFAWIAVYDGHKTHQFIKDNWLYTDKMMHLDPSFTKPGNSIEHMYKIHRRSR